MVDAEKEVIMQYRLLTSFGLGVGAALVAMSVFPLLTKGLRPLLKSGVKGGLGLKEQLTGLYAKSKEEFEDMVAEVKEEMGEKH